MTIKCLILNLSNSRRLGIPLSAAFSFGHKDGLLYNKKQSSPLKSWRHAVIILVDQDGPLADFEKGFLEQWLARFPNEVSVPSERRRAFYIADDYPKSLREKIESIYLALGFYRGLAPVAHSIETINGLINLGHEVYICTSPLLRNKHCVREKFEWVEEHLGGAFTQRIILTKDKTMVRGDILFDDKPDIKGIFKPTWEHVVFDCPYNRHAVGQRRATWDTFAGVLGGA